MTDDSEPNLIGLLTSLNGPLINTEDLAKTFAAMILKRTSGEAELARRQPLDAIEWGPE